MKRSTSLAALALLVLAGAPVKADPISTTTPVLWSYNWNVGSATLPANGTTNGDGVQFTNQPLANASSILSTTSTPIQTNLVATNLKVNSALTGTNLDTLTNGNYTLTLTLYNAQAPSAGSPPTLSAPVGAQSGTLTFTGNLNGTFSNTTSNLTNQFTGQATQSITLGNDTFTVTLNSYTPPGPADSSTQGSIGATVTVTPVVGISGSSSAPEPSTLLLGLFGLSSAGVFSWRKRRTAAI